MSLPLVFRAVAQAEFDGTAVRYEARRAGLGADFVAEVQRVLDRIANQPDRYPIIFRDVREAPVRKFPFCVYYRSKGNRVVVLAVFPCHAIQRSGRPAPEDLAAIPYLSFPCSTTLGPSTQYAPCPPW